MTSWLLRVFWRHELTFLDVVLGGNFWCSVLIHFLLTGMIDVQGILKELFDDVQGILKELFDDVQGNILKELFDDVQGILKEWFDDVQGILKEWFDDV